jgi:hypothetical protein
MTTGTDRTPIQPHRASRDATAALHPWPLTARQYFPLRQQLATAYALAIRMKASPLALPSTRNRLRRAMHQGCVRSRQRRREGSGGWWPTSPSFRWGGRSTTPRAGHHPPTQPQLGHRFNSSYQANTDGVNVGSIRPRRAGHRLLSGRESSRRRTGCRAARQGDSAHRARSARGATGRRSP